MIIDHIRKPIHKLLIDLDPVRIQNLAFRACLARRRS
jgi:hypothetical protein